VIRPEDLAADVAAVIDARIAQLLAEHRQRQDAERGARARRAAARTAGLRRRHARKLARIEGEDRA
jgi:hypothetical protein